MWPFVLCACWTVFPMFLCFAARSRSSRFCVCAEVWSFRHSWAVSGTLSPSFIPPGPETLSEFCLGEITETLTNMLKPFHHSFSMKYTFMLIVIYFNLSHIFMFIFMFFGFILWIWNVSLHLKHNWNAQKRNVLFWLTDLSNFNSVSWQNDYIPVLFTFYTCPNILKWGCSA